MSQLMLPVLISLLASAAFAQDDPDVSVDQVREDAQGPMSEEDAAGVDAALALDGAQIAAAPHRGQIRLVYTGGLGGVGSGKYLLEGVRDIVAVEAGLDQDLEQFEVYSGVAVQGDIALHADNHRVATVLDALDGQAPACSPPEPVLAAWSDTDVVVGGSMDATPLMRGLEARGYDLRPWTRQRCTTAEGAAADAAADGGLLLFAPPDAAVVSWALADWELMRGVDGRLGSAQDGESFRITAMPIQEVSRLFAQARQLLDQDPNAIHVDAGGFLDGASSVQNNALSLHRPLDQRMLQRLEPAVLVPGETELLRGARAYLDGRDLPLVATNWDAPDDLELPTHRLVEVETLVGTVRVAFVGILDPALQTWVPELEAEGVTITDPVSGVQPVLTQLYASETPPDAVVALTTASGDVLSQIRRNLRGVDVLVGDPTLATLRLDQTRTSLRGLPPHRKGAPLTLPMDGLATADLVFDGAHRLVEVVNSPWLIPANLPTDPEVSAAITRVRAETYPQLDRPLVPAMNPDDPVAPWSQDAWASLVCASIADATQADVVLLRALDAPARVPGPMTELLAVERLADLDVLQMHRVPGDKFKSVLHKSFGSVPVSCGADISASSPKPRGRSIEDGRTYRLITTDRTLQATALGDILEGVGATGPLDPKPMVVPRGQAGNRWTLRAATLQAMRDIRSRGEDPDAALRTFLADYGKKKPGMWLVRLRGITMSVDRFQGTDEPAFAEVPETQATSPSSLTIDVDADVALEYADAGVAWDLRYRQSYATLSTNGSPRAETEDDLRLSSSLELPELALGADGPLPWSPYTELLFDSELDPTLDDDGVANPRQADLSLALGLSAGSTSLLDKLRVGGFANRDLARIEEKPTEWGGKLEVETSVDIGFVDWLSSGEAYVFADTPQDDASDLRWKVKASTKLSVPLARWLSVSTYASAFALRGRVPENDAVGLAWTLGGALSSTGVFEL